MSIFSDLVLFFVTDPNRDLQFIDLCILLGCDYCDTIRGIGPKRALQLIKQYGDIETILKHLDTKKYTVPDNFPYKEVRELFKAPDVKKGADIASEVS